MFKLTLSVTPCIVITYLELLLVSLVILIDEYPLPSKLAEVIAFSSK